MMVAYYLWTFRDDMDEPCYESGAARSFRVENNWTPEGLCRLTRPQFRSESVWIVPGTLSLE